MSHEVLTPRERMVATLVVEGLSNHAIAHRLSVSVNTVESLIRKIYEKLGHPPDDTPPAVCGGPSASWAPPT